MNMHCKACYYFKKRQLSYHQTAIASPRKSSCGRLRDEELPFPLHVIFTANVVEHTYM